ncbi:MAG TPA: hypothetical protein VLG40_05240 [Candidatus Saccharimonas sp.]|nr:hypothetical protein [Candidatus Saccharimonas sp.]
MEPTNNSTDATAAAPSSPPPTRAELAKALALETLHADNQGRALDLHPSKG